MYEPVQTFTANKLAMLKCATTRLGDWSMV